MGTITGRINISRVKGNMVPYQEVHVEIIDESSGAHVLRAAIDLESFARAITGQGNIECECEWRALDLIGKEREHKGVSVYVPKGEYKDRELIARAAIQPYEIDGWQGRDIDALNHHRITDSDPAGAWYNVSFVRWTGKGVIDGD